jgi:hypothetical protein
MKLCTQTGQSFVTNYFPKSLSGRSRDSPMESKNYPKKGNKNIVLNHWKRRGHFMPPPCWIWLRKRSLCLRVICACYLNLLSLSWCYFGSIEMYGASEKFLEGLDDKIILNSCTGLVKNQQKNKDFAIRPRVRLKIIPPLCFSRVH